ncbi:MAG: hypothetical protein QHI48_06305 [Bacteroidota bacterium]|nr:hypothetical protein [Bacteroidota bacterium]
MRKILFPIATLPLLLSMTLIAGAFLEFFHGRSDGANITLEWKTRSESNVELFEVQRKAGWNGDYIPIGSVPAREEGSYYTFVDRSAYKTSDNVYIYRLRIVEKGGASSYSSDVAVTHSVSSVKRTWGSIKAMFR